MSQLLNTTRTVSNPLTMIAIFAGLAELAGTAVLPLIEDTAVVSTFVWYVMLFPTLLLLLFFGVLWFKPHVLYGPGDFDDESNFVKMVGEFNDPDSVDHETTTDTMKLENFLSPNGVPFPENDEALRAWLNGKSLNNVSFTLFLYNDEFAAFREKAVSDLLEEA